MSSPETPVEAGPLPPLLDPPSPSPSRWGLGRIAGATALLTAVVSVLMVVVTGLFLVSGGSDSPNLDAVYSTSYLLAQMAIPLPVVYALCWRFADGCRPGQAWSFLGFRQFSLRQVLLGCAAIFVLGYITDHATQLLGQSEVPEDMIKLYQNSNSIWLLFSLVIVAAPLVEEVFFRGFLLEALRHTRLGALGAILISALGWAVIHTQYNLIGMSVIFLMGLVLGWTRLRTGSLFAPIAMHATNNLVASIQLYLVMTRAG